MQAKEVRKAQRKIFILVSREFTTGVCNFFVCFMYSFYTAVLIFTCTYHFLKL